MRPERMREQAPNNQGALLPARERRRMIEDPLDTSEVQLGSIDQLPLDSATDRHSLAMRELRGDPIEAPDWMEDPGLMLEWRETIDDFEDALDVRAAMQVALQLRDRRDAQGLSQDEERRYEAAKRHLRTSYDEYVAEHSADEDVQEDTWGSWQQSLAQQTGERSFQQMSKARMNLQDALERKLQEPKNIRVGEMVSLTLPLSRTEGGPEDMRSAQWVAVSEDFEPGRGGGRFLTLESVDGSLPAQRVAVERVREVHQRELNHIRNRRLEDFHAEENIRVADAS